MIDDLDIEVLNPDYKQTQMIIQIRKIVDSIGNPNPLHWVRTESGRKCWIAHKHAKTIVKIYDMLTSEESQSSVVQNRQRPEINAERQRARQQFVDNLQTYEGLTNIIKELRNGSFA